LAKHRESGEEGPSEGAEDEAVRREEEKKRARRRRRGPYRKAHVDW
jgi:hypothetical protein